MTKKEGLLRGLGWPNDRATVTCYGYRPARPEQFILSVQRELLSELEDKLAGAARVMKDNHVVYTVDPIDWREYGEDDNETSLSFFFTDSKCIIGTGVYEEDW